MFIIIIIIIIIIIVNDMWQNNYHKHYWIFFTGYITCIFTKIILCFHFLLHY
jgi:hypothetical protein